MGVEIGYHPEEDVATQENMGGTAEEGRNISGAR